MSNIDELIETTERLCRSLEVAAENETKFGIDLCLQLEQYSWEAYKMSNSFKEIKETYR